MPLTKGRHVHLAMVGYGPLCDATVQTRSSEWVTLRLVKTTAECGRKGQLIRISQEEAIEITPEKRLTKIRVMAKVLVVTSSLFALSAVAFLNPVSAFLLANPVMEFLIGYLAWEAVPQRIDYIIRMTCSESLHCFSDANRITP